MKTPLSIFFASAVALGTLSACATPEVIARNQEAAAANLAVYIAAAGPEVNSFRKSGATLQSWQSISDDALVVYTRINEAYLVQIAGGWQGLGYVTAIRISDSMGTVSRNFDKVYPLERSAMSEIGCPITSIRPLDLKQLKINQAPFQKAKPL